MKYCLDTNVCIGIINNRLPLLRAKLRTIPSELIVVCSVVRAELWYGAKKSQTPDTTRRKQDEFLNGYISLPFSDLEAETYSTIRANLEKQGKMIGGNDLMIASIALTHHLTLVTHNTQEFSRIVGLDIEDWEVP